MAFTDRRETINDPYRQGSSLLALGLNGTNATELIGDSADPAWYSIGELEGGELGPSRDTEEILNEAGEQVVQVTNRDEFVITNTLQSTDVETLTILEKMENLYLPARYPLPAGTDGSGTEMHQMWYFPHVTVMKEDWRLNTDNSVRTRDFTIKAVKRQGDPTFVRGRVDLDDETNWPTELEDAKDSSFSVT